MAAESPGTVRLALAANIVVALAKCVGGLATGSAAMMAEVAHSVADTVNELFLLTALRRSDRPADARHPFGYGMERFFWSLLAAVGIFVAGAGFSLLEAYRSFTTSESMGGHYFLINYLIIGVALVAEGVSWVRAVRQLHQEAGRADRGMVEHVRLSSDPSVKTVASEDSAAIVGLVLAGAGLALHQRTGHGWWEGVAAAAIAILLIVVAIALGRDSKGLLIGESASPELTGQISAFLEQECPAVDQVVDLLTMHVGAEQILLAARVDLAGGLSSTDVEMASAGIDAEIQRRWPMVTQVFLDATRSSESIARVGHEST